MIPSNLMALSGVGMVCKGDDIIPPMLVINRREVESLIDLDELVDALAPAMVELSAGTVSLPPRIAADVPARSAFVGVMPTYLPSSESLVVKLVSVFPQNDALGLESHQAVIAVFDAGTGVVEAVMDGSYITATRTAAGSALATRLLAREDAHVLALLGTGVQARAHARAIPRVRAVREIRVAGRNREKAVAMARELSDELDLTVLAAASYEEAASGADIVCTATHSTEPVLHWQWLRAGAHVNSVGLNPAGRELVVESRGSALAPPPAGANDLLWPIRDGRIAESHGHAEVGELISGAKAGRTSAEQVTLYKSVGVAVQDAVAARLVLEKARALGMGTEVAL